MSPSYGPVPPDSEGGPDEIGRRTGVKAKHSVLDEGSRARVVSEPRDVVPEVVYVLDFEGTDHVFCGGKSAGGGGEQFNTRWVREVHPPPGSRIRQVPRIE